MDKAFDVFASWQTVALGLAAWIIVFAIRRVFETIWPNLPANKYWTEIFLPLGPIGTAVIIGIVAKMFPWPAALGAPARASARVMYSAICGMASGWIYARAKPFLKGNAPEDSTPPAPPMAPPPKA